MRLFAGYPIIHKKCNFIANCELNVAWFRHLSLHEAIYNSIHSLLSTYHALCTQLYTRFYLWHLRDSLQCHSPLHSDISTLFKCWWWIICCYHLRGIWMLIRNSQLKKKILPVKCSSLWNVNIWNQLPIQLSHLDLAIHSFWDKLWLSA